MVSSESGGGLTRAIQGHLQSAKPPLSGWWFQPLWKTLVSWDYEIPNIWKNKACSKPPTSCTFDWVLMER